MPAALVLAVVGAALPVAAFSAFGGCRTVPPPIDAAIADARTDTPVVDAKLFDANGDTPLG